MDSVKDAFKTFSPAFRALAKTTKSALENIKSHIQEKKKELYQESDFWSEFIEILPRVYYFPFPTEDKIEVMSHFLNKTFGANYYIWNISEHKYDVSAFSNQVAEHISVGYPSPTLNQIFFISKSILSWLNSDKDNVALVHCQESKGRSAVLLSCLMCLMRKFHNPVEALTFFCSKTHTDENSILFPSNRLYLKYFSNILDGFKLNTRPMKIIKIMFSDILFPRIQKLPEIGVLDENTSLPDEEKIFKPYLQIFRNEEIIFNSLSPNNEAQATEVKSLRSSDISCWFDCNIQVYEDVLIRCKHFYSAEIRYPIFRIMMNTGFVFDPVVRFYKKDIDFSSYAQVNDNFFIDVFFDLSKSEEKPPDTNLEYIVAECNKQAEKFKRKTGSPTKSQSSNPHPQQEAKPEGKKEESPPKNTGTEPTEESKSDSPKTEELVEPNTANILNKIMSTLDEDHGLDDHDIDQYINN